MPNWRARGSKSETSRVRAVFVAAGFVVLASSCPFPAHAVGDADHGEQLARRWCAACHIVAGDQARAKRKPPGGGHFAAAPGRLPHFSTLARLTI